MRSREYRVLRRAGLELASKYRARSLECDKILKMCGVHHMGDWQRSREDWRRRLMVERRLLAALRVSVHWWRLTVIELRPKGTAAILSDTGVDIPERLVHHD